LQRKLAIATGGREQVLREARYQDRWDRDHAADLRSTARRYDHWARRLAREVASLQPSPTTTAPVLSRARSLRTPVRARRSRRAPRSAPRRSTGSRRQTIGDAGGGDPPPGDPEPASTTSSRSRAAAVLTVAAAISSVVAGLSRPATAAGTIGILDTSPRVASQAASGFDAPPDLDLDGTTPLSAAETVVQAPPRPVTHRADASPRVATTLTHSQVPTLTLAIESENGRAQENTA
jgi:hypothetical protein